MEIKFNKVNMEPTKITCHIVQISPHFKDKF